MAAIHRIRKGPKTLNIDLDNSLGGDVFSVPIELEAIRGRKQIDFENFETPRPGSSLGKIGKQVYCAGSCSMSVGTQVGVRQWSNHQTFYPQWIG
ncbi:hypothetical protein ACI65C_006222 [Semiaphis heraclei]